MSDDFEERLKRAAQRHASKSDANGLAKKVQDAGREAFLVRFYDLRRNVIKPELVNMKKHIKAPGKVQARVGKSDDKNEIYLELIDGKKRSILVFVADPVLMRVRVHITVQIEMGDVDSVSTWQDAMHGSGDTPALAHMTLEEVTPERVKYFATEFGERALG